MLVCDWGVFANKVGGNWWWLWSFCHWVTHFPQFTWCTTIRQKYWYCPFSNAPFRPVNSALIFQAFNQSKVEVSSYAGWLIDLRCVAVSLVLSVCWNFTDIWPQTSRSERLTVNHSAIIDGDLTNTLQASACAHPLTLLVLYLGWIWHTDYF